MEKDHDFQHHDLARKTYRREENEIAKGYLRVNLVAIVRQVLVKEPHPVLLFLIAGEDLIVFFVTKELKCPLLFLFIFTCQPAVVEIGNIDAKSSCEELSAVVDI